jgi:hypothetical protein
MDTHKEKRFGPVNLYTMYLYEYQPTWHLNAYIIGLEEMFSSEKKDSTNYTPSPPPLLNFWRGDPCSLQVPKDHVQELLYKKAQSAMATSNT